MSNAKFDTVGRYMTLFERGGNEVAAIDELLGLFAGDAIVDITGTPVTGAAVADLYRTICPNIGDSSHHWTCEQLSDGRVKVIWAAATKWKNGAIEARAGVEHFTFDDEGLIARLHNEPGGVLSPGGDAVF